eukprot:10217088-Alexandrium_andersonii.AAC.1
MASQADIASAVRARAERFHPDKNPGGHTREAFNAVSHASSVLCGPIPRHFYDVLCGFLPDGPTDRNGP